VNHHNVPRRPAETKRREAKEEFFTFGLIFCTRLQLLVCHQFAPRCKE